MRKTMILAATVLLATQLLALSPATSAAQGRGGPGIGIILGEPTGLSFKSSLRERGAFDAAAAWSFEGKGFLHLHGDLIFHNWNVDDLQVEEGALGFYYGIGGRVVFVDDDPRLGIRIPVGLSYLIQDTPLEFFGELAPILDLAPESEFRLNGGLGLRYWLN